MPLTAGDVLGTFEVRDLLGAGGMGEVYRARDTRLGREVAIKVLPAILERDAERRARFEREARALAALNHPNIATLYGFEVLDGRACLVMELVPGDTLAEMVARGPLPSAELLTYFRQLAAALEAAHQRGLVHRDLKPANIKITPEGVVKVLDFGLAKAFEAEAAETDPGLSPTTAAHRTSAGVVVGTPAYMSPEQARGKGVDARTDVWALGCVLFEALAGRRPFAGASHSDAIAAVLTQEPDWSALPDTTPIALRRAIALCLRKDAQRRPRRVLMASGFSSTPWWRHRPRRSPSSSTGHHGSRRVSCASCPAWPAGASCRAGRRHARSLARRCNPCRISMSASAAVPAGALGRWWVFRRCRRADLRWSGGRFSIRLEAQDAPAATSDYIVVFC